MNAFITRIANYLANEILVKQLSQSKTFQQMALRTHLRVEKTKEFMKEGVEKVEQESLEGVKRGLKEGVGVGGGGGAVKNGSGLPEPPRKGFGGFAQAFVKEVRKDFGG